MNWCRCGLFYLYLTTASALAQPGKSPSPAPPDTRSPSAPLPDVATLMQEVVVHQRAAEALRKNYLYNTSIKVERREKDGSLKTEDTDEYEDFTSEGIAVSRHLKHNGKALSAEELKKQDEQIDKEVAKAKERRAKAASNGRETDERGDEIIPISRMFELGSFTNPRRQQVNGRDTIAVDFTGDPNARTHNRGEEIIHDMAGTAWIDEQDKAVQHVQGRFIRNFKIGGGLIASIAKDTTFEFFTRKINDEIWLPQTVTAQGHFRFMLLFAVDGNFELQATNYRKFKATSTIVPNYAPSSPPLDPQVTPRTDKPSASKP